MCHIFGISLLDRVDGCMANKCIISKNFGRIEGIVGQRKFQELNGMVSRKLTENPVSLCKQERGQSLGKYEFLLHIWKNEETINTMLIVTYKQ